MDDSPSYLRLCPACLSPGVHPRRRVNGFLLAHCSACDLLFVLPRPSEGQLAAYYARYFEDASAAEAALRGNRHKLHSSVMRRIQAITPSGRLVDVGAAYGDFVALAVARGYTGYGVEVAGGPCARMCERVIPCHCGSLLDAPLADGSVDVITFWDTLEHVAELRETLVAARRVLRPGGLLAATVPNRTFQQALIRGERLLGREGEHRLEIPSHLNHFSSRTLRNVLSGVGFVDIRVEPGPPTPVYDARIDRAKRAVYLASVVAHSVTRQNVGNSLFVRALAP